MPRQSSDTEQSKNQRHWHGHAKAQKRSGLSRAEYCRRYKLSYHALTYWQRKRCGKQKAAASLVPIPLEQILHAPVQAISSGVKIVVTGKLSIEVDDHFSSTTLKRVLSVLESR